MKDLFPERYGLEGVELAAAAMLKLYISNDENAKKALGDTLGLRSTVDNGSLAADIEIDAAQLAVLIDRAKAYCAGKVQDSDFASDVCVKAASYMDQVKGKRIVQEISAGMVDFLMDCHCGMHFSENHFSENK